MSDQKVFVVEDFQVSPVLNMYWYQYYKYYIFHYHIVNIVLYLLMTGISITLNEILVLIIPLQELSHFENVGYKSNATAASISHIHTFI
jgi:hypothetical protein